MRTKIAQDVGMKCNFFLSAIAASGLLMVSACSGEGQQTAPQEQANPQSATGVEANGTVIEIQMYTRDPDSSTGRQVFKPRLIEAKVGDTVRFIPTDPTHQSSSIEGMLPSGVTGWEGEVNKEVEYILPAPGVYGYQCVPHYAAGMVGLVIVEGAGKTDNLEAAKNASHPGLARNKFEELFAMAEAEGLL